MRSFTTTVAAACATLALTAGAVSAQTVPPDRKTFVTFSGAVSVPGMTLPAGTYTFRIMDSNTDRHIVQIFDKDGVKLMTTLLAVPAQRLEPTGDPIITFKETPSDHPPAVHYWYYAGDLAGNEFVYPKNQAMMIAKASGESVMAVDSNGNSIDDWKSGNMSRVKPDEADHAAASPSASNSAQSSTSTSTSTTTSSDTTSSSPAPSSTMQSQAPQASQPTTTADQPQASTSQPTPSTAMDQTAQPSTAPAQSPAAAPTTAPSAADNTAVGTSGRTAAATGDSLPRTASELPMVGLVGLLALGGALALRVARTA